jgi:hypothetical protein
LFLLQAAFVPPISGADVTLLSGLRSIRVQPPEPVAQSFGRNDPLEFPMGVKYSNFIEHGLHLASKLLFLQYSINLKSINSMSYTKNHHKVKFFNCQAFISIKSNTYAVDLNLNLSKPTPVRILALRNNEDYQALDGKGDSPKRFK